jgi:calcium-independent phospholipase A2
LHLACLADKPECVKALIIAGADVNIAASQTTVDSSSPPATPSSCLGDFVHENTKKLHAEVCLLFNAELQIKLIHSIG